MNYIITKTTITDLKPLIEQYLKTLNGVTDDFWEEHVKKAEFYEITSGESIIGYFSIYENEKITQFYMMDNYLFMAQPIFQEILKDYNIKTAFVATCDQLFLSLCLDFHKKIEMQAYFFDGTVMGEVRLPEYARDCLHEVKPEELEKVKVQTGDFFDFVSEAQIKSGEMRLYKLCDNSEVLGYGIIVPNTMLTQYWANGMITLADNRQKGVGRSIQMHLADICRENGFIPIGGCWYYNHLSKKTMESAGRYTKTRLLNVIF